MSDLAIGMMGILALILCILSGMTVFVALGLWSVPSVSAFWWGRKALLACCGPCSMT